MENNTTPNLSLDSDASIAGTEQAVESVQQQAAGLTLDTAVPAAPSLTLETEAPAAPAAAQTAQAQNPVLDESALSAEERKAVDDFSEKIDLTNSTQVLQYGASSQKKVADFSSTALESIRTKDLGEVGDMLTSLIGELKGFDATAEQPKGIFGFFKKSAGRSFFLVDDQDEVESFGRLDDLIETLRGLGIKFAEIHI